MRTPIIAGNWKMNMTIAEATGLVRAMRFKLNEIKGVEKVVCPPATALMAVAQALRATKIRVGAQNMHWEEKGAFTGELSPAMVKELCQYVILGHSERRASSPGHVSDEAVRKRITAAFDHGLTPIVCVGENQEQYKGGQTDEVVGGQVEKAIEGLEQGQVEHMVIAYEPIWAIGTGDAFLAGLLAELLRTTSASRGNLAAKLPFELDGIERILRFACAAAALTTNQRGGVPA